MTNPLLDHERDLHVTPVSYFGGTREHELTRTCWCNPRIADGDERARGNGAEVIVHNRSAQS